MTGRQVLVGAVIALVGLAITTPYILGMLTRGAVDDFVEMSNITGDAAVEIIEYERGWFKSRMSLAVSFPENEESSIVFDHELRHGPLLPASACGGRFGFALSTGHSSLRPITPAIEHFLTDGRMSDDCFFFNFNGNIHGIQNITSFAGTDFDADSNLELTTQIAWAPITTQWTYLNETRPKLRGSMSAPRFDLNDSSTHVQIDMLTMNMDLRRAVLAELWDGEVTITMDELRTWESDSRASVSIGRLELLMQAQTGTEEADFELSLGYETLRVADREFGEGHMSLKFEDLGTRGIQAFNERRESLLAAGIPQENQLYVEAFREFMPEMLATDPRLVLDFSQDLKGIPISAKGYARITNPDVITSDDPRQWLASLEVDLALSMPEWFVRDAIVQYVRSARENSSENLELDQDTVDRLLEGEATAMLAEMEQRGFVQKRDKAYRTRFYLRDGNATVNDRYLGNYIDMLPGNGAEPGQP